MERNSPSGIIATTPLGYHSPTSKTMEKNPLDIIKMKCF